MRGEEDRSSVWELYVAAKRHAAAESGGDKDADDFRTLEELELAIAQAAASSGIPETGLPPRASVHPADRWNVTKWFYRTLVVLFALLAVGLFWWGYHHR